MFAGANAFAEEEEARKVRMAAEDASRDDQDAAENVREEEEEKEQDAGIRTIRDDPVSDMKESLDLSFCRCRCSSWCLMTLDRVSIDIDSLSSFAPMQDPGERMMSRSIALLIMPVSRVSTFGCSVFFFRFAMRVEIFRNSKGDDLRVYFTRVFCVVSDTTMPTAEATLLSSRQPQAVRCSW